jgi:hypothetical protein
MDKRCADFCDNLAGLIVKQDFAGAHALLSPWLRTSMTPADIQAMVEAANEGMEYPPQGWSVDEGLAELADLQEPDPYGPPSKKISKQITTDNFRGWLSIQFAPDPSVHDEQNVCFDLWLIAVEHDGSILAGYLEASEAG